MYLQWMDRYVYMRMYLSMYVYNVNSLIYVHVNGHVNVNVHAVGTLQDVMASMCVCVRVPCQMFLFLAQNSIPTDAAVKPHNDPPTLQLDEDLFQSKVQSGAMNALVSEMTCLM